MSQHIRYRRQTTVCGWLKEIALGLTLLAIVLGLMWIALPAYAHDEDPIADETPAIAAMRYCQTVGVRAAWGANARFLGAPAVFKYIPEAPLKKMFMGDAVIPHDAIYVLDSMDLEQRKLYETVAFEGWKNADRWVGEGRQAPEFEALVAVFYNDCKKSLTAEVQ